MFFIVVCFEDNYEIKKNIDGCGSWDFDSLIEKHGNIVSLSIDW